jgi:hypothetical protein
MGGREAPSHGVRDRERAGSDQHEGRALGRRAVGEAQHAEDPGGQGGGGDGPAEGSQREHRYVYRLDRSEN